MQVSIVFLVCVQIQCRRRESPRSPSDLLMSLLLKFPPLLFYRIISVHCTVYCCLYVYHDCIVLFGLMATRLNKYYTTTTTTHITAETPMLRSMHTAVDLKTY